jgi:osmotically inducible protein OsmC
MERKGWAIWHGGLKGGRGTVSNASAVLKATPYSFSSRFEEGMGTNPEELIAAAHAGCFAMALSGILEEAGLTPDTVEATATVTLKPVDGAPTVTGIHLQVSARVADTTDEVFAELAEKAKVGCPISRLLKPGTEITMSASLEK